MSLYQNGHDITSHVLELYISLELEALKWAHHWGFVCYNGGVVPADKNIEHTAQTIVSWPDPKQVGHTSYWMMNWN